MSQIKDTGIESTHTRWSSAMGSPPMAVTSMEALHDEWSSGPIAQILELAQNIRDPKSQGSYLSAPLVERIRELLESELKRNTGTEQSTIRPFEPWSALDRGVIRSLNRVHRNIVCDPDVSSAGSTSGPPAKGPSAEFQNAGADLHVFAVYLLSKLIEFDRNMHLQFLIDNKIVTQELVTGSGLAATSTLPISDLVQHECSISGAPVFRFDPLMFSELTPKYRHTVIMQRMLDRALGTKLHPALRNLCRWTSSRRLATPALLVDTREQTFDGWVAIFQDAAPVGTGPDGLWWRNALLRAFGIASGVVTDSGLTRLTQDLPSAVTGQNPMEATKETHRTRPAFYVQSESSLTLQRIRSLGLCDPLIKITPWNWSRTPSLRLHYSPIPLAELLDKNGDPFAIPSAT